MKGDTSANSNRIFSSLPSSVIFSDYSLSLSSHRSDVANGTEKLEEESETKRIAVFISFLCDFVGDACSLQLRKKYFLENLKYCRKGIPLSETFSRKLMIAKFYFEQIISFESAKAQTVVEI